MVVKGVLRVLGGRVAGKDGPGPLPGVSCCGLLQCHAVHNLLRLAARSSAVRVLPVLALVVLPDDVGWRQLLLSVLDPRVPVFVEAPMPEDSLGRRQALLVQLRALHCRDQGKPVLQSAGGFGPARAGSKQVCRRFAGEICTRGLQERFAGSNQERFAEKNETAVLGGVALLRDAGPSEVKRLKRKKPRLEER